MLLPAWPGRDSQRIYRLYDISKYISHRPPYMTFSHPSMRFLILSYSFHMSVAFVFFCQRFGNYIKLLILHNLAIRYTQYSQYPRPTIAVTRKQA